MNSNRLMTATLAGLLTLPTFCFADPPAGEREGERPGGGQRFRTDGERGAEREAGGDREGRGRRGPARDRGRSGGPSPEMLRALPLMRALDLNADGSIDREEIQAAAESLQTLDQNDDGELTFHELRPQLPSRDRGLMPSPRGGGDRGPQRGDRSSAGSRGQRDGDRGRRGNAGRGGPGMGDPDRMIEMVMRRDSNGDGSISRDEAGERMQDRFDRIDADGNDHVTKAELQAAMGRARGRGQ